MNIDKLEELICDDYNIFDDIKNLSVIKDNEIIRVRKLPLKDKNFTGVCIKIHKAKQVNNTYIVHNKQFQGHKYIVFFNNPFKYFILERVKIDEQWLYEKKFCKSFSNLNDLEIYIKDIFKRIFLIKC